MTTQLDDFLDVQGQLVDLTYDLDSLAIGLDNEELVAILDDAAAHLDKVSDLVDEARADFVTLQKGGLL